MATLVYQTNMSFLLHCFTTRVNNTIDRYDELTDTTDNLDILIKLVREKAIQLDQATGDSNLERADELEKLMAYLTVRLDEE